jgi:hypothetical protein
MAELSRSIYESIAAEGFAPEGFDLDRNIELFNEMVSRLGIEENRDTYMEGFVHEELEKFFDGTQSAQQAAENLQFRLNTYLQE